MVSTQKENNADINRHRAFRFCWLAIGTNKSEASLNSTVGINMWVKGSYP